ncbi:hypothetical protein KIW84_034489 [Lathyrus oleraceus]|uniref:DEAD/DEAH-box helicase domain-containing protein n=1 Tax=Pisum sativum TaxID=3888 RepID=A0A9D5B593_PEA|nr:hypothetical protein KIW84_034489 [Pisum sativum]
MQIIDYPKKYIIYKEQHVALSDHVKFTTESFIGLDVVNYIQLLGPEYELLKKKYLDESSKRKRLHTCLENSESVMVSTLASAGKTVVALYAIAMSLLDGQRVIYTSTIKAFSNQKYREFKEEFSDVGLMTGDVTIDPNAS